MNHDLQAVAAALSETSDDELAALITAAKSAPQTAPGLLAWIEAACHWELDRRHGQDYELQPPSAAIPPEEDAASIYASYTLRETFAQDSRAPAVIVLLHVVVELLAGGQRKH